MPQSVQTIAMHRQRARRALELMTHEAMPRWLGSDPLPEPEYRALIQPLPADRMSERPVSRFMSNSRNEGPQCLEPPEEAPPELALG